MYERGVNLKSIYLLAVLLSLLPLVLKAEIRFAGVLGNSGEPEVTFSEKPATGMGPVLDAANTIWERGGSTQLNRYALDGRLLAQFGLPDFNNKYRDQLTLAGDTLLMHFGRTLYCLPITATPGSKAERMEGNVDVLSSSAYQGLAVIWDQKELFWLHPETGKRVSIGPFDESLRNLHIDADGVVYGFAGNQVHAWKGRSPVKGYPRPFSGARPQKIGDFWYSHGYHGTIHRFNLRFEPEPGVVLGGASGSFIGYLPQSVDITHGTGLVHVRDELFAISGYQGVVQLLAWKEDESRFEVVRRIGALPNLKALALNAEGQIWTPQGSWRWNDDAVHPLTLGDVEPMALTQPVVLGGKTICFLKNHYGNIQKTHGDFIDASGWAHLEARGVKDVLLGEGELGACAIRDSKGGLRLLVTAPNGKAMSFGLSESGQISDQYREVELPGLEACTSLAWFGERVLAADGSVLRVYQQSDDGAWKEASSREGFSGPIHVHSDGRRIVVSDAGKGDVQLFDALEGEALGRYIGLGAPRHVVVSGDRIVVYESGKQRLVKLMYATGAEVEPELPAKIRDAAATATFSDNDYYAWGRPGGVPISVALREQDDGLHIALRVDTKDDPRITLGVANDQSAFIRKGSSILVPPGDWSKLRLAAFVQLPDQQERVGFVDHRAIHAAFSEEPTAWAPFDLTTYHEIIAERKAQIQIAFEQPMDGKATIVIEDAAGTRVRNLVSGRSFRVGKASVVWDGLDEDGQLIAPGNYHWRGITHPGITPDFRMPFAGGGEDVNDRPWGPNHGLLHDAVSNGTNIFFAAPVTEGGWALLALDADGAFVQGYEHQHGFGIGHDAIAVDGRYLYCAQDGFSWGGNRGIDWNSDSWTSTWTVTVARYDVSSGKLVDFPGQQRGFVADTMAVGPGAGHPDLTQYNLGGLAVLNKQIYVGSRSKQAVLVFDAENGNLIETLPVKGPRHLAAGKDAVFVATDRGVVRLSDGKLIIDAGKLEITGLTVAPNGDLWLSDGASHQVHHFTSAGKAVETIGTPGGPYSGAYDPNHMVNPAGLAFGPDGKLWVTEQRWNPKRVLAWDLAKKQVVYEKFGIPHYGGDGSGFDPLNEQRWIGLGCFWDVDIETGSAKPTHIMALEEGHFTYYHPHGYSFFREGERTFLCTRGKIALLCEVMEDGTLRELAAASGTHHFAYGCEWKPPQAYIDAFYAKWPEKRREEKPGKGGQGKPWAGRVGGVLWVDRNGDGDTQVEEFSFTEDGVKFADGSWGHRQDSLTFRFPAAVGDQCKIVEIRPKGFLPNGIPDYPRLEEALEQSSTDIDLTQGYKRQGVSTARDRFGRFVFNSDPELNAYGPDGKHLWSYPNQWSDVHGSHDAPLPETGVMQGAMAILGMAKFDDQADVFFLNGNHGRCFLLTSDGLYLDEAFTDVRVSYLMNEYRLGGEIFGGMFERAEDSGKYYVQIGHGPYRIYQLHGIDQARRIQGDLQVTQDQVAAAERGSLRQLAAQHTAKTFHLPGEITWDQSGKFKVSLKAAIEGDQLHLSYAVEDASPWVNQGRDWTSLFASGDTVDIQFGVHAESDPKRREPVEGDQRLLIAPFEGEAIAVLYQHRKANGTNPIEFTSPWRGAKVDHVARVAGAIIEVKTQSQSYEVDARIPLAALGLTPSDRALRADFGVTYGDAAGQETQLRSYWANPATMLVDDIPGEIMLHPNLWGEVIFK